MTNTLTAIPDLPVPNGIKALSDWYPFGPDDNVSPARNFTVAEAALPLCDFTYMAILTVGGVQHDDGEIVSFVEIPEDIIDGHAPDSEVVRHLAAAEPLLSPMQAFELAESLEHLLHIYDNCCNACWDEIWIAATALRLAAGYLRGFRESNGMAAHDEELT
jgi:hypothetical protein